MKLAEQNADKRFSGTLQPLDALYRSYKFPNQPNSKGILNNFDAPTQVGYQYGQLLWGWFIAPQDGEYIFFSACDDACDIYMSPDEGKDHIRKIISQNQWSLHNEFDKYVFFLYMPISYCILISHTCRKMNSIFSSDVTVFYLI